MLGYGLVNAITTGLIFSAASGGSLSTIVGIVSSPSEDMAYR